MKGTHEGIYTVGLAACICLPCHGSLFAHFHLAHCPRSLYCILGLYNADFSSSSVLQCQTVGGNIWNVKKQLPLSIQEMKCVPHWLKNR